MVSLPLRIATEHRAIPLSSVFFSTTHPPLRTGCHSLDYDLCDSAGPFRCGVLTEVFGAPSSGKTQLCLTLCARAAQLGGDAIYLDSEGSFSATRIGQLVQGDQQAMRRVYMWRVCDMRELVAVITILPKWMETRNVRVIVVDSVGWVGRNWPPKDRAKMLGALILRLKKIAVTYQMPVVVVNQTISRYPNGQVQGMSIPIPALGNSWAYHCPTRIELSRVWPTDKFSARIIKSSTHPRKSVFFRISDGGLSDHLESNQI